MYYMLYSKTRCSAYAKHLFEAVGLFIFIRKVFVLKCVMNVQSWGWKNAINNIILL